jgi:hypothetical protein
MRSCAAFSTRSGNSPEFADTLVMMPTPRDPVEGLALVFLERISAKLAVK